MKTTITPDRTKILKSKKGLEKNLEKIKLFLETASTLSLWQKHFENHNFRYNSQKFDWNYWQTIPFFSSQDYKKIGFPSHLNDAEKSIYQNIHRYVLCISYRKLIHQANLFISLVSEGKKGDIDVVKIQHTNSFGLNLYAVLQSIMPTQKQQLIILDAKNTNMQLNAITTEIFKYILCIDPSDFFLTMDIFSQEKYKEKLKKVILFRSFKKGTKSKKVKKIFTDTKFVIHRPFLEMNKVVKYCPQIQKRFGSQAVHPQINTIIELRGVSSINFGEVVITKLLPIELGWIRYRTGLFAKGFFSPCTCGNNWILIFKSMKRYKFPIKETYD